MTSTSDDHLLNNITAMGFTPEQAKKAVAAISGDLGPDTNKIDACVNWIIENAYEEPDGADDPSIVVGSPAAGAQVSDATSATKARDAAQQKKDATEMEEMSTDEEKASMAAMTPEDKQKFLLQKLEDLRHKKKEDEERRAREREIKRRKEGKEAIEAKKKWEQKQRERLVEEKQKERELEKKRKQRVKEKLRLDKLEREAEKNYWMRGTSSTTTTGGAASSATASSVSAITTGKKEYTECTVQVRLPNGNIIKGNFRPNDDLRAVYEWVQMNRTDGGSGSFALLCPYPRKRYTEEMLDKTSLTEAQCVPRGTLIVG